MYLCTYIRKHINIHNYILLFDEGLLFLFSNSLILFVSLYIYIMYIYVCTYVGVDGIENVNLTHIIHKHTDYCTKMKEVLTAINLSQPHTYEVI